MTYPSETGKVSADRPALTPAMIEAGAEVLERALGGAVTSFWSAPDLAASVYRAMANLACESKN
jgi:hypothetical protein